MTSRENQELLLFVYTARAFRSISFLPAYFFLSSSLPKLLIANFLRLPNVKDASQPAIYTARDSKKKKNEIIEINTTVLFIGDTRNTSTLTTLSDQV